MGSASGGLTKIVIEEIQRLIQIAYEKHEELEQWRAEPLDATGRVHLSVDLKQALERVEEITKVLINEKL